MIVLGVVRDARRAGRRPVEGVVLDAAEKALFDIGYAAHVVEVERMREASRYVTEEERARRREARRPKREDWRTLPP